MVLLLPLWLVLFAMLVGWGLLLGWLLQRASIRGALTTFQTMWLGYAGVISFVTWLSLVLPIARLARVLVLVTACAAAYACCDRVTAYDTPLYHLQIVKWDARYSAVPGLANLHLRFG